MTALSKQDDASSAFIHLKVHSEYSISNSIVRLDDLMNRIKSHGMPAVAITDNTNLFALVKFYRKAVAAGIKPIAGATLCLKEGEESYYITLLCQNNTGYLNLTQLISKAYIEGQVRGCPTIQWDWLTLMNEGLIVLSGGKDGDVGRALLANNQPLIEMRLKRWLQYFPDRYYLELHRTNREGEAVYLHEAIALAERFQVPVVATNNVYFMKRDDFEAHEARVCIHSGHVLDDSRRPRRYTEFQYLRSSQEMIELFSDIPEALQNTVEIAKRCTLQLSLGTACLPQFPLPEGISLKHYLEQKTSQGLTQYFVKAQIQSQQPYQERLNRELGVINEMGFAGYFLIVADFIGWAKEQNIPVGPGRGSGAGSLVAFVLGITELDPIEHELLFQRFLNPERVSMPDFDIDFCMERRDEVIDYVAQRYGRDAVSQIITYGTMAAKAVIRDVGRVLGMPYGYVDKIAKLIPFELGITLMKALGQEDRLADLYHNEDDVKTLIDLAFKLEGIVRNAGKHAGGVVIAPTKLTDFTPIYCDPDGKNLVTQFDKNDVEAVGLVKFDFLGLRTLTIIHWALEAINKKRGAEGDPPIDISRIPLDDAKTYQLLRACATTAVFQLESRGMKELIRRLQPDSFSDIMALVALFRPGPLQSGMVDDYIDRKHGRSQVRFSHPALEPILQPTYGVILYQDQVMQIAQVLAGYSLGGADILRSAMGKKKPEEMAKQREVFIKGATKQGVANDISEHIFDIMEKFAGYGFNKSHSAAYALISYQTAWLKAHYPSEFMSAVLSSDMDNTDKVVSFLNECESMKLEVLPPNINVCHYAFVASENGKIEYGLGAIKGVGEAAVINMIKEREKNGPFKNLFDFCQRIDSRKVNKRVIEPLIFSGAMDVFKESRSTLMTSLAKAMKMAEQKQRNEEFGQGDMFGSAAAPAMDASINYVNTEQWDEQTRLQGEKKTLGFYLSGHPLQAYEKEFTQFITAPIARLDSVTRKSAILAGILVAIRTINTRGGKKMAVLTLEDRSGHIEVTLFNKLYDEVVSELQKDQIYVVKGNIEDDDYTGGVRIVANSIESLDKARERLVKRLVIQVKDHKQADAALSELSDIIQPYCGGPCPVTIAYHGQGAGAELQLGESWCVNPDDALLLRLKQLFGETEVSVEY